MLMAKKYPNSSKKSIPICHQPSQRRPDRSNPRANDSAYPQLGIVRAEVVESPRSAWISTNQSLVGGIHWYTYPSEKYESVGMMKFPIYGKIKVMFQTTNQIRI